MVARSGARRSAWHLHPSVVLACTRVSPNRSRPSPEAVAPGRHAACEGEARHAYIVTCRLTAGRWRAESSERTDARCCGQRPGCGPGAARCCQVLPGAAGPVLPGAAGCDRTAGPVAPAGVAAASGDMLGLVHKLIHIQDMFFGIVAEEQRVRALQATGCGGQVSSLPGPLSLTSVPVLFLHVKQRGALISVTAVTRPGSAEPERACRAAPSRRTRRRRPQEQRPPWSGAQTPAWSGARTPPTRAR